jgi:hypothetical protein
MNNTLFIYYEKSRLEKSLKFAQQLKDIQDYYSYELPRGEAPKAIFIKGYRMWLGFSDGTAGLIADIGADLKEAIYNEQNKARGRAKRSILISRLIDYPEALELFKDLTDEVEAYKERHAAKPEKLRAVSDRERIEVKINSKGSDLCENLKLDIEKEILKIKNEAKEEGTMLTPLTAAEVFGYPGETTYPGEETYPGKTIKEEVIIGGGSIYKKTPKLKAPTKMYVPSLKGFELALRPGSNISAKNGNKAGLISPLCQLSYNEEGKIIMTPADVKKSAKHLKTPDTSVLNLFFGALLEKLIETYDEDNPEEPFDCSVLDLTYVINLREYAKRYANTTHISTESINSVLDKLMECKNLKGAIEDIENPGEYEAYAVLNIDKLRNGGYVEIRSPYISELIKRVILESDVETKKQLDQLREKKKELEEINPLNKEAGEIISPSTINRYKELKEKYYNLKSTAPPLITDPKIRTPFFTNKISKLNFKSAPGKDILIQMVQVIEQASKEYPKRSTPHLKARTIFNNNAYLMELKAAGKEYRMQMQRAFKAALDYLYDLHLEEYFKDIQLPDRDLIPRNERELDEIVYKFTNKGRYNKDDLKQEAED